MGSYFEEPETSGQVFSTNLVPIGGVAPVFRSGDAYKAVGEVVKRSDYPELSAAFPRNGSVYSQPTTSFSGGGVEAIAVGNGVFVAAPAKSGGASSTSVGMFSHDGLTWYTNKLPVEGNWTDIAFGLGLFVLIDESGKVCTSPDGQSWTVRANLPASTGGWSVIEFGGGKFVALSGGYPGKGAAVVAASSTDGINFTARTMPTSSVWCAATYGGGIFVALSSTTAAATSTDGVTWTSRTVPEGPYQYQGDSIAYGNGMFVMAATSGMLYRSTDGIAWTAMYTSMVGSIYGMVAFGNGAFLVVSAGITLISSDGINWRRTNISGSGTTGQTGTSGMAYMAGFFVVVNSAGNIASRVFVENTTDSEYLYLSGTAGQFVRVK